MTSAKTSTVKENSQKANVIVVLKATCKELEARKKSLEELTLHLKRRKIQRLRMKGLLVMILLQIWMKMLMLIKQLLLKKVLKMFPSIMLLLERKALKS